MLEKADDNIMFRTVEEIAQLLHKHLKGELSSDDKIKLDAWINQSEQNRLIFQEISNEEVMTTEVKEYYDLLPQIEEIRKRHSAERSRVVDMFSKKTTWPRWVAAASVILLIVTGTYYFLTTPKNGQAAANTKTFAKVQDITPATNKAILTLDNGSQIVLDNTNNGIIAQQDRTTINKRQDGELIYSNTSVSASEKAPLYNTVSTPRGGKYQLTLPDGSKVWLNAASSLHFPIAFTGNERKVELTGEAYFEVTHNESKPFKVAMLSSSKEERGEVVVLGTRFDANSYVDEPNVKVTLLQGSVKVSKFLSSDKSPVVTFIKPGQQAVFGKNSNEAIAVANEEDPQSAIAWINGRFSFQNAPFTAMMRELSRWYDVDVVYEGPVPANTIVGDAKRTIPLSELLPLLGQMVDAHFKIEGRTVRVISDKQ